MFLLYILWNSIDIMGKHNCLKKFSHTSLIETNYEFELKFCESEFNDHAGGARISIFGIFPTFLWAIVVGFI